MSVQRSDGMSIAHALAMTVAEIPVFLYSTFGQSVFSQLKLTPSLKKVLFATALGSVALALTAHQLKRRGRKRKAKETQKTVGIPDDLIKAGRPSSLKRGPPTGRQMMSPSTRSNDTMSGISSLAPSKHSSSSHSLASMRVPSSPNQSAKPAMEDEVVVEERSLVEDANAENLYLMGMELFEEALRKWEQALNIRHSTESTSSNNSLALRGAMYEQPASNETRNKVFAEKLETLLHRAYHLQEDFGSSIPADSVLADFESEGTLILPCVESFHRLQDDDATTVTSDDSFFSAAEIFDALSLEQVYQPLRPAALYEEALSLVREGKVAFRSLRTELLECYSDQDFLAKLHCVRQAFQMLLLDESHRTFFMETGKQMIAGLMVKANKSPKAFLESYEDMLLYTKREETWPVTKMELEGRGVVCMNFFDIVLDFILMDAFEDLENPPSSVVAVLRNRWLSDSFKETALATACWSVLKAKRRLLMVPDGFISHFYAISEHVSPVLAFGFLGPRQHLSEVCTIFKKACLPLDGCLRVGACVSPGCPLYWTHTRLRRSAQTARLCPGKMALEEQCSAPARWRSISLTHIEFADGDLTGQVLAYISLLPIAILVGFVTLIVFKRELHTISFFTGILLNEGVNWLLKHIFREPRPCAGSHSNVPTEYGMPSSHSQLIWFFVIYFFLFLYLRMHQTNNARCVDLLWRHILSIILLGIALSVSYSRVYLLYHTWGQVFYGGIAGTTIGIIWFFFTQEVLTPLFPKIAAWPLSEYFLVRDTSLIPNILWFEYTVTRSEARNRQRKLGTKLQ
ncbi:mitoguardin 2 isoform X1 [Boleophthalmus pectinirostris]|uniref:mitoguardin 2 isoform X1 n=1 Tax=Boleophthalmus pectinirostris TaxID=150288 RepID=UPI002432751C|nr:mitoguardin 2 isoform X1 [Boleophthalmus pectinirostris]